MKRTLERGGTDSIVWLGLVVAGWLVANLEVSARDFRVARIPNGNVFSCAVCHTSANGGGTRTVFGNRVSQLIGGSSANVAFWTPALAAEDTDGDGVSNGAELGDPDGDGVPTAGVVVSHPGNRAPGFTSTPVAAATVGTPYQYNVVATNATGTLANIGETVRYALVQGPAWLTVTTAGVASGTPTAAGTFPVAITVRDSVFTIFPNTPFHTRTQQFDIVVTGGAQLTGFALWQSQNFNLPAEAALAEALADPDTDGMPNLVEYALRLPPKTAGTFPVKQPTFDAGGHLQLAIDLRDDDPKLGAVLKAAGAADFAGAATIQPVVSDPTPGDGFKRYSFTDTVASSGTAGRFVKVEIQLSP